MFTIMKTGLVSHFNILRMKPEYLQIQSLDSSKAYPKLSIPVNILKENCDTLANKILIDFNSSVDLGTE